MKRARTALHFIGFAAILLSLAPQAHGQLMLTSSLFGGIAGVSYSGSISVENASFPVTFTVMSGQLPPGLMFSGNGTNTFVFIAGTPTTPGSYSFTVMGSEQLPSGGTVTGSQSFSIQIATQLVVTTSALVQGTVGMQYTQQLEATGGTPPYTWTLGTFTMPTTAPSAASRARGSVRRSRPAAAPSSSGSLPPGLLLSSNGQISGIPTQAGSFSFNVTVSDSSSSTPQSTGASFSILINPLSPLMISTASPLPAGTVGTKYSIPLYSQGGSFPVTWTLASGTLPPGLVLGSSGSISGTPTQAGTYTFTLKVTDELGDTASGPFTLTIGTAFSITTPTLAPGAVGVVYSAPINVSPTTGPYTFTVSSGTLPAGLTLSGSSTTPAAMLSGTPTAAGSFPFTVSAADSAGNTATQSYTLVINAPPITITPATLPDGTLGTKYSETLTATGGAGGYVFTMSSGAPPGIGISSAGMLSGTPTATGTFNFSVTVTDKQQTAVTQVYQLTINSAPVSAPMVTGVGSTAPPAQQPALSLQLGQPYPTDLTGTITLTFAPAAGSVDDPAIQFSTGGRTVTFQIPAGKTTAVFPATMLSLATGTVAGTITLTLDFKANGQDVTPQPAPTQTITIGPQAPVITTVTVSTTSGGIEVDVTGFSNPREMTSATFTFQAASGTTLQGGTQTITVGPLFATWYSDATSDQFGSEFTFAQPFNFSGSANGVTGVSVTLTNSVGTSAATTASVP